MTTLAELRSIRDVCEVRLVTADGADLLAPPAMLLEVPHGATRERHFEAIRRRLTSALPEDLREFFFVNTDVGAPECAARVARSIVTPSSDRRLRKLLGEAAERILPGRARSVLIVRSLVPRTFIDCNRLLDSESGDAEMTAAVPDYVQTEADLATLRALYDAYHTVATEAYRRVCGSGGTAIQLHTYAPRSIRIDRIDANIVDALRRAYAPEQYERWERRPEVDIISRSSDGRSLAPTNLVGAIRECFARIGVETAENATYHLHPATTGHRYSVAYPGRILCIEISRDRLADPFTPFEEMTIGTQKLAEMSAPLAAACLGELTRCAN
jgi:hypothetical protein